MSKNIILHYNYRQMAHHLKEKTLTLTKELHHYQIEAVIYKYSRKAIQEKTVRRNQKKKKIIKTL